MAGRRGGMAGNCCAARRTGGRDCGNQPHRQRSNFATRILSSGNTSSENHGLRFSQILLRGLGCGMGRTSGCPSTRAASRRWHRRRARRWRGPCSRGPGLQSGCARPEALAGLAAVPWEGRWRRACMHGPPRPVGGTEPVLEDDVLQSYEKPEDQFEVGLATPRHR